MDTESKNFDPLAATWDDNPARLRLSNRIARSIEDAIELTPRMRVLDYGCGTGLISLRLGDQVGSILAVDSSRGMLAVLEEKIDRQATDNIRTLHMDMDTGANLPGTYDLVICSMTLHHVRQPGLLLRTFFEHTRPGGCICVAELDPDRGWFHGYEQGVFHHGFDRRLMTDMLEKAGYTKTKSATAAEIVRFAPGGLATFRVFLAQARRTDD